MLVGMKNCLIRCLAVLVLVGSLPVLETAPLWGQTAQKKTPKKRARKPSQKTRPTQQKTRQRPAKKTSRAPQKSIPKKPPAARKRPARKVVKPRPKTPGAAPRAKARQPRPPKPTPEVPGINAIKLAGEIYDITEAFQISSRELARATAYLQPAEPKRMVRLASRPTWTTVELEAAANREPNDLRLQRKLGLHYEALEEWDPAKDVYIRILAREPLNPDAHFFLGSYYARRGNLLRARQSFEEALDLSPNHRATIEAMATWTGSTEDRSMSAEVLKHSARKDPQGPAQDLTVIRNYYEQGDYPEVIELAAAALEKYPQHSGFRYFKGQALEQLGETEKAKATYQEAIVLNPQQVESHLALARLYFNLGKYIYAALAFSDAVALKPNNREARFMQGHSYYQAQEWGRAAAAWEDLLHYDPHQTQVRTLLPQTYYILAIEYNRRGQTALGRTAFSKALSVNPNTHQWLSGALRRLGIYYRDEGLYKESLAAYQEVLELSPNDAGSYTGMGVTYWKMKERQLARAAWQRSLELDPENNTARGWLILSQQAGS